MAIKELLILLPSEDLPSRTPIQPLFPVMHDSPIELLKTQHVRRATVVLVVTSKFRVQGGTLVFYRIVHVLSAPTTNPAQATPESLSHRLNVDSELSLPAPCTDVRETEEVECCGLSLPPSLRILLGEPTKFDEAGFVRMKRQPVFRKPLWEHIQHSLGIPFVLKADQEIVRESNQVGLPSKTRFHNMLEPHIEHVVKVDIGQERTDDLPLTRSRLRDKQPSIIDDADIDPLP